MNQFKAESKSKKTTTILGSLVVLLSCAFISVSVFAAYLLFRAPLGQPMALDTAVPQQPVAGAAVPVVRGVAVTPTTAPTQAPAPTQAAAPVTKVEEPQQTCGNTGSQIVLLTGEDSSKGQWPLGADAVRVAKFDYTNKKITVVAFPRDLWVQTPWLADQKFPETTLGLSYYYQKQAVSGEEKQKVTLATENIGKALLSNFGLAPQNYFTIQLDISPKMIDTIGGVEINVPEAVTTEFGLTIPAGPQTMNGTVATEYVRTPVQGEAKRLQRQELFIKALQNKVLSVGTIAKVPELYKQFDKSIVTDLSPKQIADLACMAQAVPQSDIVFHEIGGDLVTPGADTRLIPNVEKIKAKLVEWLGQ